MQNPFITIDEASELTGLNRQHLAQLRYHGTGPIYYPITPRQIRYKREEVIAWMEESAHRATNDPAR